ncbi:MAG: hypothetical protein LUG18_10195 [Candidatus Azobacteroides sp.]|nr:hypothetical protein [Candidatus Azobacteroides sp.]
MRDDIFVPGVSSGSNAQMDFPDPVFNETPDSEAEEDLFFDKGNSKKDDTSTTEEKEIDDSDGVC